jgi:hypothetical protein
MDRPFDGADARWVTLSQAMAEGPDQDWIDWALEFYGDDPRLTGNAPVKLRAQPVAAEIEETPQLTFSF